MKTAKTKPGKAVEYIPELPAKLTAPRLNLKNLIANRHDLGTVRMSKELITTAQTDHLELSNLAERVLADLVATGTREPALGQAITAKVLGEGLRRLRDLAFTGTTPCEPMVIPYAPPLLTLMNLPSKNPSSFGRGLASKPWSRSSPAPVPFLIHLFIFFCPVRPNAAQSPV